MTAMVAHSKKDKKENEITKLWLVQRPTESNALSRRKKGNNHQQHNLIPKYVIYIMWKNHMQRIKE